MFRHDTVEMMAKDMSIFYHGAEYFRNHIRDVVHTLFLLQSWNNASKDNQNDMIIAGYLHDIIEDTEVTYGQLRLYFNGNVVSIVESVTDEPGANRKERKSKTYAKTKANPLGTIVKIADRIANLERGIREKRVDKLSMYLQEANEFESHFLNDKTKYDFEVLMNNVLKVAKETVEKYNVGQTQNVGA